MNKILRRALIVITAILLLLSLYMAIIKAAQIETNTGRIDKLEERVDNCCDDGCH